MMAVKKGVDAQWLLQKMAILQGWSVYEVSSAPGIINKININLNIVKLLSNIVAYRPLSRK